jgi:four helix bundle protein
MQQKYDLDDRLINFASGCLDIAEKLPPTYAGIHLGSQLVRSGVSPALHYGEAHSAESQNDFIHKMKVCLKELRETFNCLRLIQKRNWIEDEKLSHLISENNQLIAIFIASLKTAQRKK